jgi:hypothetical protein
VEAFKYITSLCACVPLRICDLSCAFLLATLGGSVERIPTLALHKNTITPACTLYKGLMVAWGEVEVYGEYWVG